MMNMLLLTLLFVSSSFSAFPHDFLWGTATAAYQIEGAYSVSRGETIWDVFTHTPNKIANNSTGDVAVDHYHRYVEDIALMKSLGMKNYRLSIAWARLFPSGTAPINPEGVAFYNNLINELIKNDIQPFVTLFHWDLPAGIENGWLNPAVVDAFAAYADASFSAFGDRVKKWLTLNEPYVCAFLGYGVGNFAPGRCSDRGMCPEGNSTTEPYIAAHHMLLAHAAAVNVYRQKYQASQSGVIGITLNSDWVEPFTSSADDAAAAQRRQEFMLAWFADPVFLGDYPQVMKTLVGDRLPQFSDSQKQLLNGSADFFGLNHYTTNWGRNDPNPSGTGWSADQRCYWETSRNGQLIGPQADSPWLFVVPWGVNKLLHWIAARYSSPAIYITENGVSVPNEDAMSLPSVLDDTFRTSYLQQYISNISLAIDQGVNVRGYFAWSFMDNFEWADGYTKRFGLVYVDYNNNLTRTPKASALWYSNFTARANSPNPTGPPSPTSSPTTAPVSTTSSASSLANASRIIAALALVSVLFGL